MEALDWIGVWRFPAAQTHVSYNFPEFPCLQTFTFIFFFQNELWILEVNEVS